MVVKESILDNIKMKNKISKNLENKVNYAVIEYISSHSEDHRYEYSESNILAIELTKGQSSKVIRAFEKEHKEEHPREPYENRRYLHFEYIELWEKKSYFRIKYLNKEELYSDIYCSRNDLTFIYLEEVKEIIKKK